MKKIISLRDSWFIRQLEPTQTLDEVQIKELRKESEEELSTQIPAQVHEILLKHGRIDDPRIPGNCEKCKWVAEKDWIYRCTFEVQEPKVRQYLHFKGLDTLVDIYLNGKHIASHNNMYLPLRVDVSKYIEQQNILLLHFHSPYYYLDSLKMPKKWNGKIPEYKLLRKTIHDFIDFLGPKPYLTNIGVFDEILLKLVDEMEILEVDINTRLTDDYKKGVIKLGIGGQGYVENSSLHVTVKDPDGNICAEKELQLDTCDSDSWLCNCDVNIDRPQLWWPRTHGIQPLYTLMVSICVGGELIDQATRKIGFRDIKMASPFDFRVNGRPIRLWGANLAPIQRISNCWDSKTASILLDMAENAHMNILRVWGEGVPYPDELYDEADRRGILLWQEFYTGYGMQPDDEEFRRVCKKEAEYMVKRLKHHPSILMWCGGNESVMGAEYDHPGEDCIGREVFIEDYKEICHKLDPDRYYHENSPYGGSFANDPAVGDTHGYTHIWYVPGADYPIMLSENTRISTPGLKSLKRYIGEENIWPEDFDAKVCSASDCPLPETWMACAPNGVWPRIKNYEKFYEVDSPESLVYRLGSAHALHLKETVERIRRGKPSDDITSVTRCLGHLVWKLNEPWPAFYSSMIDYYLEGYIPYYTLKRAYQPVMLSFDIGNYIYLWVINDSPEDVKGTVICQLFNPKLNKSIKEIRMEVSVSSNESKVICRLDQFGQFRRENFLYACLIDQDNAVIARENDFVDYERYLYFPDAKLDMKIEEGDIIITSDKFARCIELIGKDENGDEFGWFFDDNYFDLMPGEVKRVKVLGRHSSGVVSAKAHYSNHISAVEYKRDIHATE